MASTTTELVANVAQLNRGTRASVMPGARSFSMVTIRSPEASTEAKATRNRPPTQRLVAETSARLSPFTAAKGSLRVIPPLVGTATM